MTQLINAAIKQATTTNTTIDTKFIHVVKWKLNRVNGEWLGNAGGHGCLGGTLLSRRAGLIKDLQLHNMVE